MEVKNVLNENIIIRIVNLVSHHYVTPAQFCHVPVCSVIKKGSEPVSPLPWHLCGGRTEDGMCHTSPANEHASFQLMDEVTGS